MNPEPQAAPAVRTGFARSGDVEIAYEDMGDPNHPAVLLIMGLGAQLLLWRKGFCDELVSRGYRVIRYDKTDNTIAAEATGTITTNLPPVGTLLGPHIRMSVGGTSSVVGIACMGILIGREF